MGAGVVRSAKLLDDCIIFIKGHGLIRPRKDMADLKLSKKLNLRRGIGLLEME